MNKKQIAAINQLKAALVACEKAGVYFANVCDSTLTPYAKGDIVTYTDSIRVEGGKILLWDEQIPVKNLTYLEYHNNLNPRLEAHAQRFKAYESLQIVLPPTFLRTISDDGLVIVKNRNA